MLRYSSGPYWNEYLVSDLSQTSFTLKQKLHSIHLAWAVAGKTEGISSLALGLKVIQSVQSNSYMHCFSLGCRTLSWAFSGPGSVPLYVWSSDLFLSGRRQKQIYFLLSRCTWYSVCSSVVSVSSKGRQASNPQQGTCTLLTHIKGRQKVSHTAYGTIYWWGAQAEGVNWLRQRFYNSRNTFTFRCVCLFQFSLSASPLFNACRHIWHLGPSPLQGSPCLNESRKKQCAVEWYGQRGCSRWGLIKVEELLSPGVSQRPSPQGGVNAQLAVTGVKVWHWSYDTTECSRGEGITRDSVCREHHVRAWWCLHSEQRRCDADKWERRNWPLYPGCHSFNQQFIWSETCSFLKISLFSLIQHLLVCLFLSLHPPSFLLPEQHSSSRALMRGLS